MDGVSSMGALDKITYALGNGNITPEAPMVLEGEDLESMLKVVDFDLATRLRDCTNGTPSGAGDNGILLTFHRNSVPLSDTDNLVAEGIPDEAGVFLKVQILKIY